MGGIFDIINVPIGYILRGCYALVDNYGIAILLFALITRLLLLPLGIKSEKGRRKMMKAQPRIQQLQQKYKGNTRDPRYQEEMQKIYSEEGYSPMAGCLPQLIQLPIILSLWTNIRSPLTYLCDMSAATIERIFNALGGTATFGENATYTTVPQLTLIQKISENYTELQSQGVLPENYQNINLNFLGLNLGDTPQFAWNITVILPFLAALSSFLVSFVSQKINQNGTKQAPGMNAMLYLMPLITLFLGYTFQIGICIYWIFTNILMIIQTVVLAKVIREKEPEPVVKEKKLNYNQIEKQRRLEEEKEREKAEIERKEKAEAEKKGKSAKKKKTESAKEKEE